MNTTKKSTLLAHVHLASCTLKGDVQKVGRFVLKKKHGHVWLFRFESWWLSKNQQIFPSVIDDGDSEFAIGTDAPFRSCTIPVPVRIANLSHLRLCQFSCAGTWWRAIEQQLWIRRDILTCRMQIWSQFLLFIFLQWAVTVTHEQNLLSVLCFCGWCSL